ncbi:MAG: NAD+ synthase [Hyphomicrobiales bacterium]|nr:NAD+ synthase [Hyphomicrobiales bacterium]
MSRRNTDSLKIASAQLNPTVGDLDGNLEKARKARAKAARDGADLVAFPELFVSGYPPDDLVMKPVFEEACRARVEALAGDTADGGPAVLMGAPWREDGALYNAYVLLEGGKVDSVRFKVELPNYGPFDEKRVFKPGPMPGPINFRGVRIGVPICEDIWIEDVPECLMETGAELLIVPNGSPFWKGKFDQRLEVAVARVVETGLPLVYVNQVGGQDELIFDGASFGLNGDRSYAFQQPAFKEEVGLSAWRRGAESWRCAKGEIAALPDDETALYTACVLGLRDYVNKNGFPGVLLGLSGGIDSALCAVMSVDALGADRVHCLMLPYKYTSNRSIDDATACAETLGVRFDTVPIAAPVEGFERALAELFKGLKPDVAEENIQARARGTVLMAVSNKFGAMVVTTGNKSEVSVGYTTLYGDMAGGFNPIKDLYKTQVYALSAWRNANRPEGGLAPEGVVIPPDILVKPPSAELRADQTDQDTLPPYDILDDILECLVEKEMSVTEITARGHDAATVRRVEHMLYVAEYKRRQAAPGVKVTQKNFGRDRRYPITNRFRDRTT